MSEPVTLSRSPRYPRYPLMAAVGYAQRLYEGAHRSTVDTITAYKVMGFAGKSGASATALGSAKQFGLVESVGGGVRVSDLGMEILEPSSQAEYSNALRYAVKQPPVFQQIFQAFPELPRSDEAIRSYLIRNLNFSKSGADECISSLRESLIQVPTEDPQTALAIVPSSEDAETRVGGTTAESRSEVPKGERVLSLPLTKDCSAQVRFDGKITSAAIEKLIKHLELAKDTWAE